MAGLLTAAQLSAIREGNIKVRQKWSMIVPTDFGITTWTTFLFHDDTDPTKQRVIDAGSRQTSAYNISLKVPGTLRFPKYEIEVDNSDGYFSLYDISGVTQCFDRNYMIYPKKSFLKHEIFLFDPDGTESELPCSPWIGRVIDVIFTDQSRAEKDIVLKIARIVCDQRHAVYYRRRFNENHGDIFDTGANHTL